MKKIMIFSLLIVLAIGMSAQNAPKNVEINMEEYRDVNLSEIAQNVSMVNLSSPSEYPLLSIQNFIIAGDSYFVLAKCAVDERAGYVLQFGKNGSFIRRIGLKDEKSGDFILASGLYYSSGKIYVKYSGRVGVYDKDGGYVTDFDNDINFDYLERNCIWFKEVEPAFENGTVEIIISRKNIESGAIDDLIRYSIVAQGRSFQTIPLKYSSVGDNVYVVSNENNTVYSYNTASNILKSLVTFDIEKDKMPLLTAERFVFGNIVHFAYIYKGIQFVYLYDMVKGTGVNSRITRDQNGVTIKGIKDDLKNTGFVDLKQTNVPGKLYFTQKKENLTMIDGSNNLAETVVFVVNID